MSGIISATRRQRQAATAFAARFRAATTRFGRSDRGDVPGWVLITLMTAGLVTLLWGVAGDQLETLFTNAINKVAGPSK